MHCKMWTNPRRTSFWIVSTEHLGDTLAGLISPGGAIQIYQARAKVQGCVGPTRNRLGYPDP
eukprot:6542724-Ditylum_brightwellii.AAC.1